VSSAFETISTAARIYTLLKPITGKELSIKAHTVAGQTVAFNALIFEVAYQKQRLVILKKSPTNTDAGVPEISSDMSFDIVTEYNGAEIRFTTQMAEQNEEDIQLLFPESVQYLQRRMAHREHVSYSQNIILTLPYKEETVTATVRDISAGGLRLFIDKPKVELHFKDVVEDCTLTLSSDLQLSCTLEVRHAHRGKNNQLTLGVRFLNLDKTGKRILARFIMDLERHRLKNKRNS